MALKILPVQLVNWIVKLKILNIFTSYGSYASMSTTQFLDSITDNEELKAVIAYCYGDYGKACFCPVNFTLYSKLLLLRNKLCYSCPNASNILFLFFGGQKCHCLLLQWGFSARSWLVGRTNDFCPSCPSCDCFCRYSTR